MKRINLYFLGLGYYCINQANVCIYDKSGRLVRNLKSYNGKVSTCLCEGCYYLVAKSKCETINKVLDVNCLNDNYTFIFRSAYMDINPRLATFILTDRNYDNLPIEKGNLILWQRQ